MSRVSGTPFKRKGNHSSMNSVSNRNAAKITASPAKMSTHTTASLVRNEKRPSKASTASQKPASALVVMGWEPRSLLLRQVGARSEEHTSELQSRQYLVC